MLAWLSSRAFSEPIPQIVVNDAQLSHIQQLIASRTGLNLEGDRSGLHAVVTSRVRTLGIGGVDRYIHLLESSSAASRAEWNELAVMITNGESHFFRDQGQIALLREEILPELIARNASRRTLRIWSAGCSTGEEPYTLAMIVHELLPDRALWDVTILGSDINHASLARARRGLFGNWSFRTVSPELRNRYFRQRGAEWELRADIRSMVNFREGNITSIEPGGGSHAFDLIICRNVFIYFDRVSIAGAIRTFAGALADGGYLLTGHGELSGHDLCGLQTRRFKTSLIYQRVASAAARGSEKKGEAAVARTLPLDAPPPARSVAVRTLRNPTRKIEPRPAPEKGLAEEKRAAGADRSKDDARPATRDDAADAIAALLAEGSYERAVEAGVEALEESPRSPRILALVAHAYANRGRYEEATRYCRDAIAADPLPLDPYYLLGHIAEETGDLDEAKRAFGKVLYLSSSSVAAYLHLADIHEREGTRDRARTLRTSALALLERMDPSAVIANYGDAAVRDLVAHLRGMLG